jgi:nitrogen-specific signal transduction histidine kinase
MEKQEMLKGETFLNIAKEGMVSVKEETDLKHPEVRTEWMGLSSKSKEKSLSKGENVSLPSSFLIEMAESIKKNLYSIYKISFLSFHKFDDAEFRKYSQKSVMKDVKRIDWLLNLLLNYISVNTPIVKRNTIHITLEKALERNEKILQAKNIRTTKKYDTDLPETFIHDELLRFILNSVLQYAIFSTPSGGSIGILTKSFILQEGPSDGKVLSLERKFSEIRVVSSAHKDPFEKGESLSEALDIKKDDWAHLILLLIKELLQRNEGMIEFQADEKKSRTFISLRLPGERRQVVYYEPIKLSL